MLSVRPCAWRKQLELSRVFVDKERGILKNRENGGHGEGDETKATMGVA